MVPNTNYNNLKDSYLFFNIAQKINAYLKEHEGMKLYRMGIGDVSLPLCDAAIKALHEGVDDQSKKETFHGYMPECGAPFLRETISGYYGKRGVSLSPEEVFVSSGASDELGDILDIFGKGKIVLIMEPAYPAYVDANVMFGNTIIKLPAGKENGFLPKPSDLAKGINPDVIYICSPNNPTGAVFSRAALKEWVDFANETEALIVFDAAYEAFITDGAVSSDGSPLPHSIFEIEGARTCAIEICSLSKTAGFTGTRCGYTAISKDLKRGGMSINDMWVRNRTTKTNGISYILQKGAAAIFTEEGQKQIHANIDIYKNNAKVLMEAVDALGVWYTGGENAPYIWMECPGGLGSWEFFDRLLTEYQVVGTPGEGFGKCGEGYFRFSCFGSPEDTVEAAKRLKEFR
ncbi:MAG: LL-diaminopimelate aminotransferase [Lachnospiraceae bacterium]|nr:LL-diaminopimelate aminotransferase [Lachnospiraceae bacterium]